MITTMPKRSYNRRSDEDRINELQAKVAKLKAKLEQQSEQSEEERRKESKLFKEVAKVQKALLKFEEFARSQQRMDLALSAQAFSAGLERTLHAEEE